jgi:hypothetical protein
VELSEFRASLANESAPASSLNAGLRALWFEARGDWVSAHELAQAISGPSGAWLHAYLHRREGDASNAGYWYAEAGQPFCRTSLEAEWEELVRAFLISDDPLASREGKRP